MTMDYPPELLPPEMPRNIEVVEDGKKVIRYDTLSLIYQAATAAHLARLRRHFQDRESTGLSEQFDLDATEELQEFTLLLPAQSLSGINRSPASAPVDVKIHVNSIRSNPHIVGSGEQLEINFETHKIRRLLYKCPPGQSCVFRVNFKW